MITPTVGSLVGNNAENGENWTQIDPGVVAGNYWTIETSGSTLTIDAYGYDNTGSANARGSIAGVIVEQIPEPATLGMIAAFGGGLLAIRRKLMM